MEKSFEYNNFSLLFVVYVAKTTFELPISIQGGWSIYICYVCSVYNMYSLAVFYKALFAIAWTYLYTESFELFYYCQIVV